MSVDRETAVSHVEVIKREGNQLRGEIAEELINETSFFTEESIQQLKFHGVYQQDDRDLRKQLKKEGREKHYQMMIRARIPGGVLPAAAYLQFDRLAEEYGNKTMRITTRQTFQLHGVLKGDLKKTIAGINEVLITTLGGCGDQVRNILMCPAPHRSPFHQALRRDLLALVDELSAKTNAYHEIWLDGEKWQPDDRAAEEPLYGKTYLPRKFKLALAVEGDNCVDVYANDLGIVAHRDGETVAGYSLLVGGGMGRTAAIADTFPRMADPLTFVTPDQLIETCREIVKIQRDFGNRADRRYSRFKYLLHERGLAWFRDELSARLGRPLVAPRELTWEQTSDHLGFYPEENGRFALGIYVQNGRIHDTDRMKLRTVLREIMETYAPEVHLTCDQNLILSGLTEEQGEAIKALLLDAGVPLAEQLSNVVRYAMACPALPTCGLATAESERMLPDVLKEIDQLLAQLGLQNEVMSVRMTGCSDGCARPYIGDIGFVGRTIGKYDLFLGGDFNGARMNALYQELLPITQAVDTLRPLLLHYKAGRKPAERFGDYCHRVGFEALRAGTLAEAKDAQ